MNCRIRGQALVLSLFFLAAAALVAMMLFNSGLLANQKTKLQNAADAGAYSAAVIQARDHNFSAYTNRAMVANQIAVAQMVSLKSYFEDAAATQDRMGGWWLSFLAFTFPESKPVWDAAEDLPIKTVADKINAIAPKAVTALDKLIAVLGTAQQLNHTETVLALPVIANEVVMKNDPGASLTMGIFNGAFTVKQIVSWNDYTKQHRANDSSEQADRFANVVVDDDSTDGFIQNRGSVPLPAWASTVKWCIGADFSFTAFGFVHLGATRLSADKKGWLGLDASTGGGAWTCEWIVPPPVFCICIGSPLAEPGGSGGALAGTGDYSSGVYGNQGEAYGGARYLIFGGTSRYSDGPGSTMDSGGGLQDNYRDLADTKTKPADQSRDANGGTYRIAIQVEHDASSIRTTEKLLPGSTTMKLTDSLKGKTMRTIAVGHAYFFRPKNDSSQFTKSGWARHDGKTELANLFNPYWQPSLVEATAGELAASFAAQ